MVLSSCDQFQGGGDDMRRVHKASACAYLAKVNAYWATWDKSRWEDVIDAVNRLGIKKYMDAFKYADPIAEGHFILAETGLAHV